MMYQSNKSVSSSAGHILNVLSVLAGTILCASKYRMNCVSFIYIYYTVPGF